MENDIENTRENMVLGMMGQRVRAGHAKQAPIGDRMINSVRAVIWEAWEMGLDNEGATIYPTIPYLDRDPAEPEEPEP